MDNALYVGVDVHERESQLVVIEQGGAIVERGGVCMFFWSSFVSIELARSCFVWHFFSAVRARGLGKA